MIPFFSSTFSTWKLHKWPHFFPLLFLLNLFITFISLNLKILNTFRQKLLIRTAHHTFLESRHPEVIKDLYYVLSTHRSQIPIVLTASAHGLYWRLKKISCTVCLLFYYFFGDKKQLLKALLSRILIHLLMNYFDLPLAVVQKRGNKTRIKAVMLLCLEVLGERCSCFSVRDC